MFVPIHLLPRFDPDARNRYHTRWFESVDRYEMPQRVLELIKRGAGEDFLQWHFEQGELPILESYHDLKGITIAGEDITFPPGDNFEVIDFSYASFHNCTFRNATFPGTTFLFTTVRECRFIRCTFGRTEFFGAQLEKCEFDGCDFIEDNAFTNCDLVAVKFEDYFTPGRLFYDCRFDAQTVLPRPMNEPHIPWNEGRLRLDTASLANIHRGEVEGYKAGGAVTKWEQAYLRERESMTRHNVKGWKEKSWNYFLEYLTGYGILPLRVFRAMLAVLLAFTLLFGFRVAWPDALLLSSGAFFTFGAKAGLLDNLPDSYRAAYVLEAFLGVSLIALFISAWANRWFRER